MKIKAKQSFYIHEKAVVVNAKEEIEVSDVIGRELVAAEYAEEVVAEQPKKPRKKAGDE